MTEYCLGCMRRTAPGEQVCPACGYLHNAGTQPAFALPAGTLLHEKKYLVGRVLGQGGFGITYIGMDLALELKVALKEYYPRQSVSRSQGVRTLQWHISAADRDAGREGFVREARKMAKTDQIPGVVQVRDIFFENETAYIVMGYIEGETLKDRLLRTGPMGWTACMEVLRPVMESLEKAHRLGLIHRDVSPDNIMLDRQGTVWLLDLGAAKEIDAGGEGAPLSTTPIVKRGFSPPEQSGSRGRLGPWTDVYALCATVCYCLNGKLLPDAMDRMLGTPLELPDRVPPERAEALRKGLALRREDRIQNMADLRAALLGDVIPPTEPSKPAAAASRRPRTAEELPATEPMRKPAAAHGEKPAPASKKKGSALRRVAAGVLVSVAIYGASELLSGRDAAAPSVTSPTSAAAALAAAPAGSAAATAAPVSETAFDGVLASGVVNGCDVAFVGAEAAEDGGARLIRFYYDFTNGLDHAASVWGAGLYFTALQDGAELELRWLLADLSAEENKNTFQVVAPGKTRRGTVSCTYAPDGGPVTMEIGGTAGVSCTVDPARLPGRPAASWEITSDPDAAARLVQGLPVSDGSSGILLYEYTEDSNGERLLRVYYTFTNSQKEETSFLRSCTVYALQDGYGLEEGHAVTSVPEENNLNKSLVQGQSVNCVETYRLRGSSPVAVLMHISDTDTWYGYVILVE